MFEHFVLKELSQPNPWEEGNKGGKHNHKAEMTLPMGSLIQMPETGVEGAAVKTLKQI